jgi:hypothetical protein
VRSACSSTAAAARVARLTLLLLDQDLLLGHRDAARHVDDDRDVAAVEQREREHDAEGAGGGDSTTGRHERRATHSTSRNSGSTTAKLRTACV